jgi:uncharacterized membrane protein YdcZ (DUF606 family)
MQPIGGGSADRVTMATRSRRRSASRFVAAALTGLVGFLAFNVVDGVFGTSHRRLDRWLWFAGLYAASVVTLAVVAYVLRALLQALR